MRVIISDASLLVDLGKAQLIEPTLRLPYEFVMPDVMFADELLELGCCDRDALSKLGLKQGALDGDGITRALRYSASCVSLGTNECFALVLAETQPAAILLSYDQDLRTIAGQRQIEAYDLLWATDQIHRHTTIAVRELYAALVALENDRSIRLRQWELRWRIDHLARILEEE